MASSTPSVHLPAGMRDFSDSAIYKRAYIQQILRQQFQRYGFAPLETPAMEQLSVLSGTYGEEGEQLLFKVLNNGLHKQSHQADLQQAWQQHLLKGNTSPLLTERALKYDLTIPLARYVAMNEHTLAFPFKRFQMQPVWRADRPQKGRYREFTQCDADIVGSHSRWDEIELLSLYADIFEQLRLDVRIPFNHRSVLAALQQACERDASDKSLHIAIDKVDKIGIEKTLSLLENESSYAPHHLKLVETYLTLEGDTFDQLETMKRLGLSPELLGAVEKEVAFILKNLPSAKAAPLYFDPKLARGLDYYTGCIFEVKTTLEDFRVSIGGGGRYDRLTERFGGKPWGGIGISFGLDRIVDAMDLAGKFPENLYQAHSTQALWIHFDETQSEQIYPFVQQMRTQGIRTEMYPSPAKMDKQLKYAEQRNIPFVIIAGAKEWATQTVSIKRLSDRTQFTIGLAELAHYPFNI